MTRRELRDNLFKLLFRIEFNDSKEMIEQLNFFFEERDIEDTDKEYISNRYNSIMENLQVIDDTINEISDGWKINRIGKAELTILRIAVFEIKFDEDIPSGVAINEAVELSKKYCADNAKSYVNGVLAKLV